MLINLNNHLSVCKYPSDQTELWSCFIPAQTQAVNKRTIWQPVTGRLSARSMKAYLDTHYPGQQASHSFSALVAKGPQRSAN